MEAALAGLAVAVAALLIRPAQSSLRRGREVGGGLGSGGGGEASPRTGAAGRGWMWRFRYPLTGLASLGAALLAPGQHLVSGLMAGLLVGGGVAWVISRAEPASRRRDRAAVAEQLPSLTLLLAAALGAGADPQRALTIVTVAYPGPGATRLETLARQLQLGGEPGAVWETLARDEALAPLGRALARSGRHGSSVVAAIEGLAAELAGRRRAEIEQRARSVGVHAALPLGLCLLPSFILLGVVPVAAGLMGPLLGIS